MNSFLILTISEPIYFLAIKTVVDPATRTFRKELPQFKIMLVKRKNISVNTYCLIMFLRDCTSFVHFLLQLGWCR